MRRLLLSVTLVCGGILNSATAQGLLADLDPGADPFPNSGLDGPSAAGSGWMWFVADDLHHGRELWVSDGTANGTRMFADMSPWQANTEIGSLVAFGNRAMFTAGGPLWSADAVTGELVQIASAASWLTAAEIPGSGRLVFFTTTTANEGNELWVSDGTVAGTRIVSDLEPGAASSNPTNLVALQGGTGIVFKTTRPSTKFWWTDGSVAGTRQIAQGTPWVLPQTNFAWILAAGPDGSLITDGATLWSSDHSVHPATPIHSGASISASNASATALGTSFVYLFANGSDEIEIWKTDGTTSGTAHLASFERHPIPRVIDLEVHGGVVYFAGYDSQHGVEPWMTDGTPAGTGMLADVFPGVWSSEPHQFVSAGANLLFAATRWDVSIELFASDGSATGTRLVRDIFPGPAAPSSIANLTAFGSRAFFRAVDGTHGHEPWISDGTEAGTTILSDIARRPFGSNPRDFVRFGQRFVFAASDTEHGEELWISDGTAAGTNRLDLRAGPDSSRPRDMIEWKGKLWFTAEDASEGRELWCSDGTPSGTQRFFVVNPGNQSGAAAHFHAVDDRLVFWFMNDFSSAELWSTDGTVAGTVPIDFNPGLASRANPFARSGDFAYFVGEDVQAGLSLWRTNGTVAGTTMIADVSPSTRGGQIVHLTAIDGLLWFAGTSLDNSLPVDVEPWISDGTASGTRKLIDIAPGTLSSSPYSFVRFGNRVWFATNSVVTTSIYTSDGTAAGTQLFANVGASTLSESLVVTPDRLFLGVSGGIFSTDGTPGGSSMVPIAATHPHLVEHVTALGASSRVVFSAVSNFQDRELWTSDGTVTGTHRLLDAQPGPRPSNPAEIALAGDHLLLTADSAFLGREPYHARLAELSAAFAGTFGRACNGSTGAPRIHSRGTPRLGDTTFAVTLSHALPLTPAMVFAAPSLSAIGEFGGCTARLSPPAVFVPNGTDQSGNASLGIPIPNDPSLMGIGLYFEWLIADPQGGFLGILAQSDLLEVVLGT